MRSNLLVAMIFVFSVFFCGCNTDEDMQAQYDLGYNEGYAVGLEEGYATGYDDGLEEGASNAVLYPIGDYYVDTAEDPLTIRDEARQNAKKLGTIPRGADIRVEKTESHWGYVNYDGIGGWVNLDYCSNGTNPNPPAEYTSETVYVTNTGECYHKDGCGYLKSKIPISLNDARSQGYRPCSRCY